jgi:hypothetical protein
MRKRLAKKIATDLFVMLSGVFDNHEHMSSHVPNSTVAKAIKKHGKGDLEVTIGGCCEEKTS